MSGMRGYARDGRVKIVVRVSDVNSSKVFCTHLFMKRLHSLGDITSKLALKYPTRELEIKRLTKSYRR